LFTAGVYFFPLLGGILADDAGDITAFEAKHRQSQPWLFLNDGRLDRLFADKETT